MAELQFLRADRADIDTQPFTSRSRIYHLYEDVTITGEGLQNVGQCLVLRAFERGGIFIVLTCCDTGPRFFWSHPKDHTIQSPLTTYKPLEEEFFKNNFPI
jgi:hypothetical protein